jgi:thiamine pyrophosphokinase
LRAVIFANGQLTTPPAIQPGDLVIAADGGGRHCLALGIQPHVVIGDFDSLTPSELERLETGGAELVRFPERKDFTDLELALKLAQERGADEVRIIAALGDRWDQTLANLLLPASDWLAPQRVSLVDGAQEILWARHGERLELRGQPGDTVSLVPLVGDAGGINTWELEYPLHDEPLQFGSTRGISNVLIAERAYVSLQAGLLLCVVIHKSQE